MKPELWHSTTRRCISSLFLFCSGKIISATCSFPPTSTLSQLNGWEYQGCYQDSPNHLLNATYWESSNATVAACAGLCSKQANIFFGVESGTQCYCGDAIPLTARALSSNQNICNSACCGDPAVACGGNGYISVYQSKTLLTTRSPSATAGGSSSSGGNDSSSDRISLGVGISFGMVTFILAIVTLGLKYYHKRNPKHKIYASVQNTPTSGDSTGRSLGLTRSESIPLRHMA